ncbi:Acetyltransferase (GNAT) family protein [Saccharopolyspora antimicrobica]|uniref:Acetyltransferase (GNAT) family protein n=1 Tax=Saccharopolyspora antimicrobica TaxID=455193 RepID=A0A1I5FHZ7_9PSEU|nr:GNAT family N-acetyltransferase [Saccharopolyspora antimicrobica]RKT82160.1 acetyltransferase (GNAT) family protein [Saccharopolyspora antimicrobica]SFO23239.1 Acetyltransferase (GNAT) family protein [Saccharopolyspora antimicrobica]
MATAQELLQAQCALFAELDPQLPERYPVPRGEPLVARTAGGDAVAGIVARTWNPPGSVHSLWQPASVFELFPLIGEHSAAGMSALLAAWRDHLHEQGAPERDSACLVTWPSRDVRTAKALLDGGFTPLSCLAVRPPTPPCTFTELSGTVTVRRAGPADLDAVVELTLLELEYAALVGSSTYRPDAPQLKRTAARVRLHSSDPVWLAERDGVPVAVAECGWVDADLSAAGHRLRPGTWAYVNCVSVHEQARGTGVGQRLMTTVHEEFARAGVVGSFLYYNPPNPLSSVFWPRQGYRPLWTMWEVRPATALR